MNASFLKHRRSVSASVLCVWCLALLLLAHVCTIAQTRTTWTSVRSKNFLFIGDADERDIRRTAVRLEQFRDLFSRLLAPRDYVDSDVPTTVIVFKTDAAYKPFKPLYQGRPADVAGHFQSSADVNYMTLSADRKRGDSPYFLILHEYVHLLVKNNFRDAPLWFNEGLAEYYSTLRTSDAGRRITLGGAINTHRHTLRRSELIPLETLLNVKPDSPYYNETGKRHLFYAQSWAFVHMLLSDAQQGTRPAQLSRYLDLLATGVPVADAFHQAFQTDFKTLDNELKTYVTLARYAEQTVRLEREYDERIATESRPVSEAEAQAFLGDLLLRAERLDVAETRLQHALALDPQLASAHTSLGVLRLRENRFAEAKEHLRRATDSDPQSYLAHYYYASALSRERMDASLWVTEYTPEAADLMRTELRRAMTIAPRFVEAYRLYAFVNLVRDERLDEAVEMLRKALHISPARHEITLLLAQVHLRREEFDTAQRILEPLTGERSPAPHLRAQAQSLLASLAQRRELAARRRAESAPELNAALASAVVQPCDMTYSGAQHKRLRFEGEQRCGMLVRVECDEAGIMLVVQVGDGRTLKLRSDALNRIRFVTYTADVRGQITCGQRDPANPVLITFRAMHNQTAATSDGEVIAVEFVPKDWYANN